jgi:hypothetical protein
MRLPTRIGQLLVIATASACRGSPAPVVTAGVLPAAPIGASVALDGGGTTPVMQPVWTDDPAWSPSGEWLAYVTDGPRFELVVVRGDDFHEVARHPVSRSPEASFAWIDDAHVALDCNGDGDDLDQVVLDTRGREVSRIRGDSTRTYLLRQTSKLMSEVSLRVGASNDSGVVRVTLDAKPRDGSAIRQLSLADAFHSTLTDANPIGLAADAVLLAVRHTVPDNESGATGAVYSSWLGLVDLRTPDRGKRLPTELGPGGVVVFAPGASTDSAEVAVVQGPGAAPWLFALPSGATIRRFSFPGARTPAPSEVDPTGDTGACLAFDRTGQQLAFASHRDPLRWFSTATGELRDAGDASDVGLQAWRDCHLVFSANGDRLAYFGKKGFVTVVDTVIGAVLRSDDRVRPYPGAGMRSIENMTWLSHAALSPDLRYFAVSGGTKEPNAVEILDLGLDTSTTLRATASVLVFSPDARLLVVGHDVWDVASHVKIAHLA